MNKYIQLKTEYDEVISFLRNHIPDIDTEQVENYVLAAALKIWSGNLLYSPDYQTLIHTVTEKDYTLEQIVTAMGCCGDEERKLLPPGFFIALSEGDKEKGSDVSLELLEKLNSLFIAIAMINGDFTIEEAAIVSDIMIGLRKQLAACGLVLPEPPDYNQRITEKNEESYLQNDALVGSAGEQGERSEDRTASSNASNTEQPSGNASPGPVNITINMNTTENSPSEATDTNDMQPLPPEETPSIIKPAADDTETIESLLEELDSLVGLENVKKDVHSLMNFIKVARLREQRGMKVPTISYHLVFTGNPGTGKTTVARLVGKLYYHMGILPEGQLVETDRSALVAGYLGQTAIKTQKVIQQAMGGVLFIDEAYSLAGDEQDSYGKEAIETILKAMEDHRDEMVVIVAGYTELMHKFIDSNPGLSSRFSKYFEFPDYTGDQLIAIFERFCTKNGYVLEANASEVLLQEFARLYENRDDHFGNARTARNIFEKAINAQADRIALQADISDQDLQRITADDIRLAIGGTV